MLDAKPKTPPVAEPLKRVMVVQVEPALHLLFGAVALVLLIACANLATLFLARSARRATEFAVRAALGASRTRIARRLVGETLILYSLGGGAGALLAFLALSALRTISDSELPRASEIGFDGVVLAMQQLIDAELGSRRTLMRASLFLGGHSYSHRGRNLRTYFVLGCATSSRDGYSPSIGSV